VTKEDTENAYMLFYQKYIQAPKQGVQSSHIVKEEVKKPAAFGKTRNNSSTTFDTITPQPNNFTVPTINSDDEDDFLPDLALIESLRRYPSAYPSKDRITNKLTEIAAAGYQVKNPEGFAVPDPVNNLKKSKTDIEKPNKKRKLGAEYQSGIDQM
jgi:hypothetical protein